MAIDFEQQLAVLRSRIARIDRKYQDTGQSPPPRPKNPARFFVEEWASGEVVTNQFGSHFQMERLYERHRRHGSADIGALAELPCDLFNVLGEGNIPPGKPGRWAFLDTETTGLAGGSGTYAFLIGVGSITAEGFRIRQFFMREYAEEKSLLAGLTEYLSEFDVLITYNGRTYDQPLLETRYRMNRLPPPFSRLPHMDLLFGARRIWKLRYENCRLSYLENQVLGVEREGDLPGELIPYVYFEYLRSGETRRLVPIFHHNAIDILSLGCLAGIVPAAFQSTDSAWFQNLGLRRGEEYLGIGRWFLAAGDSERGVDLLERAVARGLPDALLFRTQWDLARIKKRLGNCEHALELLRDLAACRNPHRASALVELSKHYEHREPDHSLALKYAEEAAALLDSDESRRRVVRLKRKLAKPRSKRLL